MFNSSLDAIKLVSGALEHAGFGVIGVPMHEVRDGTRDIPALIATHDPAVIVYDIGPPYRENWAMFERLRQLPAMQQRHIVITAANARQVEPLVGDDERIYEVVDNPADLSRIATAAKEAMRARETRPDEAGRRTSNVHQMPERRVDDRRTGSWSSDDLYLKLREKREAVELERRRFGRRATDRDHGPTSNAA